MALSDLRSTVLEIINETRRKLGLTNVSTVTEDKNSTALLDYLNDVVSTVADYGDWKSLFQETDVTASSSVRRYSIPTDLVVKNIFEMAFEGQIAPMRLRTVDDLRRWDRISGTGVPRNWQILSETSAGNPEFDVYPQPGPNQNNEKINVAWYSKPALLTSSDGAVVPPFSSRLLVNGLLMMALLDESRGTQNIDYLTQFKTQYEPAIQEEFNRLHGDSGTDTYLRPRIQGFRRV